MDLTPVQSATLYVTTRFYPALPAEYGALAVEAVEACNAGDERRAITIPEGLNPTPRTMTPDRTVTAYGLVEALRLWHMLDSDED